MRQERLNEPDGASTVYTYEDAGRHVRTTNYDAAGTATLEIGYEHSPSGQVTGWKVFRPAGVLFKRFERRVNAEGLMEDLQFDANGHLELRAREIRDQNGVRLVYFD